jgi:hypothetical protein
LFIILSADKVLLALPSAKNALDLQELTKINTKNAKYFFM